MTPAERHALALHLLRAIAQEYVRLGAELRALVDTLEAADVPVCQSYSRAREDGERRASHTGREGIDDG